MYLAEADEISDPRWASPRFEKDGSRTPSEAQPEAVWSKELSTVPKVGVNWTTTHGGKLGEKGNKASSSSKPQKKLSDLFHESLKDIYFAENKIIKTLPKMAKAAQSRELTAAFNKHLPETQGQVKRLNKVFSIIGKPARGKACAAINGIAEESAEIMKEFKGMPALDAGLLAAAQAVEHYEICRYGTLRTWAKELGLEDAAALLQAALDEEMATDKR